MKACISKIEQQFSRDISPTNHLNRQSGGSTQLKGKQWAYCCVWSLTFLQTIAWRKPSNPPSGKSWFPEIIWSSTLLCNHGSRLEILWVHNETILCLQDKVNYSNLIPEKHYCRLLSSQHGGSCMEAGNYQGSMGLPVWEQKRQRKNPQNLQYSVQ